MFKDFRDKEPNLPDHFVERIATLEIKLELLTRNYENLAKQQQLFLEETKRSRLLWHLIDWLPGGPKAIMSFILAMVFISSVTAEIFIKVTGFDKVIRNSLIEHISIEK